MLDHPLIPEEHRVAAESVRAHLVHHRGGAPFLSPADALLLVRWLEQEVPVRAIFAAIERCSVSRRKNGARRRFTLTGTKVHLGRPPLLAPTLEPHAGAHPFQPAVEALSSLDDPHAGAAGEALLALQGAEVERAVRLCGDAVDSRWASLPEGERLRRLESAIDELGDLANLVDEATLRELGEELARYQHREEWPRLDTPTFVALAGRA